LKFNIDTSEITKLCPLIIVLPVNCVEGSHVLKGLPINFTQMSAVVLISVALCKYTLSKMWCAS